MSLRRELALALAGTTLFLAGCGTRDAKGAEVPTPIVADLDTTPTVLRHEGNTFLVKANGSFENQLDDLKQGGDFLKSLGCVFTTQPVIVEYTQFQTTLRARKWLIKSDVPCAPEIPY